MDFTVYVWQVSIELFQEFLEDTYLPQLLKTNSTHKILIYPLSLPTSNAHLSNYFLKIHPLNAHTIDPFSYRTVYFWILLNQGRSVHKAERFYLMRNYCFLLIYLL